MKRNEWHSPSLAKNVTRKASRNVIVRAAIIAIEETYSTVGLFQRLLAGTYINTDHRLTQKQRLILQTPPTNARLNFPANTRIINRVSDTSFASEQHRGGVTLRVRILATAAAAAAAISRRVCLCVSLGTLHSKCLLYVT